MDIDRNTKGLNIKYHPATSRLEFFRLVLPQIMRISNECLPVSFQDQIRNKYRLQPNVPGLPKVKKERMSLLLSLTNTQGHYQAMEYLVIFSEDGKWQI